jgi:S1-C subfamily serine protease
LANSNDVFERNVVMSPYQPILMEHWGKKVDGNLFATRQGLEEAQHGGTDQHSVFAPVTFVSATTGDFRVRPDAATRAIGFESFAIDVGVASPRLRRIAKAAPIPALLRTAFQAGATTHFLGTKVKSVETLGEQSAAGLGEVSGVLVLGVDPGSPADRAGLKVGDVIIGVENDQGTSPVSRIDKLPDLMAAFQARKWQGSINLRIQRNQTERNLLVTL